MQTSLTDARALGAALRSRRRGRGWTQAELAEAAGVSRRFVGELEGGERTGAELGRVLAVIRALDLAVALVDNQRRSFDDALREALG